MENNNLRNVSCQRIIVILLFIVASSVVVYSIQVWGPWLTDHIYIIRFHCSSDLTRWSIANQTLMRGRKCRECVEDWYIEQLTTGTEQAQRNAEKALVAMTSEKCLPILLRRNENLSVYHEGLRALIQHCSGDVCGVLVECVILNCDVDADHAATWLFGSTGDKCVRLLEGALHHNAAAVRAKAADALAAIGPEGVSRVLDSVIGTLDCEYPDVTVRCIQALDTLGYAPTRVCQVLIDAVDRCDNRAVRYWALETLRRFKADPELMIPLFTRLIGDPDEEIAAVAACGMGTIGKQGIVALDRLVKVAMRMNSTSSMACINTIEGFGRDAEPASGSLLELLRGIDTEIGRKMEPTTGKLHMLHGAVVRCIWRVTENIDIVGRTLLTELKDSNRLVRFAAIRSVGDLKICSDQIAEALRMGLHDGERIVRAAAVVAMNDIGVKACIDEEQLYNAMISDEDDTVRYEAGEALKTFQSASKKRRQRFRGNARERGILVSLVATTSSIPEHGGRCKRRRRQPTKGLKCVGKCSVATGKIMGISS